MTRSPAVLALAAALASGCVAHHQVAPRPAVAVEHGKIVGAELMQRPSVAQEGAIVGGFLGFLLSGRSLPEKIFGTWLGAAAGSAVAESNAGPPQAWAYTVRFLDGRTQRVLTERPDLRSGDCVAVETARFVNLRRVADALCEPPPAAAAPAEPSIQQQSQAEASSCEAAKEELTRAKTREETEVAIRRVRVFCDM